MLIHNFHRIISIYAKPSKRSKLHFLATFERTGNKGNFTPNLVAVELFDPLYAENNSNKTGRNVNIYK